METLISALYAACNSPIARVVASGFASNAIETTPLGPISQVITGPLAGFARIARFLGSCHPATQIALVGAIALAWTRFCRKVREAVTTPYSLEESEVTHTRGGLQSWLLSKLLNPIRTDQVRQSFRQHPIAIIPPNKDNPHGKHAASRSSGDEFVNTFAAEQLRPVFSISMSPKDQWNEVKGTRHFFHEKDLRMHYREDQPHHNDLIKMVDVDYYLTQGDIARLIAQSSGVLLYTLQPEMLGSLEPHFTTAPDGTITESHAGSTPYVHKVWNWNIDYLTTVDFYWDGYFPVCNFTHSYVESRSICNSRKVILIQPACTGGWLAYLIYRTFGKLRQLQRWQPTFTSGVNVLAHGDQVIIAGANEPVEHRLPYAQYYEARALGAKITSGALQKIMDSDKPQYHLAALISKLAKVDDLVIPNIPVDNRTPLSYRANFSNIHDDDITKVKGQIVFAPLLDVGMTPASCKSNDLDCLNGRLVKLQKPRLTTPVKMKYYHYAEEFPEKMVPDILAHRRRPWTTDQVIEAAKSSQKLKYNDAIMTCLRYVHKAFQKTEFYDGIKTPRNISAVDPAHVVKLLCYIIPLSLYMKGETSWYYFGIPPKRSVSV
jgi:hypothetical protein